VGLAFGAISYGVKKVFDFADQFSDKVLNLDALATISGTTLQNVEALQNAFAQFNIPTDRFQSFFETTAKGLLEASKGVQNAIFDIVQDSRGQLSRFENGQLISTERFIRSLIPYLASLDDAANRLRVIQNITGADLKTANDILHVLSLQVDEYDQIIERQTRSTTLTSKNAVDARAFQKNLSELSTEWGKLYNNIEKVVVPILGGALKQINTAVEVGKTHTLAEVNHNALKVGPGPIARALRDLEAWIFGEESFSDLQRRTADEDAAFYRGIREHRANSSNITMNNNIEINVPAGTENGQVTLIASETKRMIEEAYQSMVRQVQTNFPQVE